MDESKNTKYLFKNKKKVFTSTNVVRFYPRESRTIVRDVKIRFFLFVLSIGSVMNSPNSQFLKSTFDINNLNLM